MLNRCVQETWWTIGGEQTHTVINQCVSDNNFVVNYFNNPTCANGPVEVEDSSTCVRDGTKSFFYTCNGGFRQEMEDNERNGIKWSTQTYVIGVVVVLLVLMIGIFAGYLAMIYRQRNGKKKVEVSAKLLQLE